MVVVYYMTNHTFNELMTYREVLDEESSACAISLEMRLIDKVLSALQQVTENYKQSFKANEDEQERQNAEKKCKEENIINHLINKLERQWRTFLVHYHDILVYHSVEYVVKNNPYAKRLMNSLEETDKALKNLTGQSLLQIKILEVEDKYRPRVNHVGKKIPRIVVAGEED